MEENTAITIIILVIIFLIFFIVVLLCLRLVLYKLQKNDNYQPATAVTRSYTPGQPLTKEQGEALFDLRDCREKLRTPLIVTRSRDGEPLETGRLNALQTDTYYQLFKWSKRLQEAKQYGDTGVVASQLINEMESRAMDLPLDEHDKRRFWDLAQLPDDIIVPFDTRQRNERILTTHEDPRRINFVDRLEN